ncbi:hypothetical protein GCM10007053_10180 [Halioglobus pacificus]|uniref:Uncharacterized protein n=1 Tax=Parahalioglobus pacificus TaxID=930806 RepID=A0A918XFZ6_9GAMM|nr:hypothetical protein GCM10007053_10180 [Halioglobus pacificus]
MRMPVSDKVESIIKCGVDILLLLFPVRSKSETGSQVTTMRPCCHFDEPVLIASKQPREQLPSSFLIFDSELAILGEVI